VYIIPCTHLILLCVYKLQDALIKRSTSADSLAGHYAEKRPVTIPA